MISVCFRFDDPSATSDHNLEKEIFKTFSSFEYSLTVAVIPYRKRSGDIIEISKENVDHLIKAKQSGIIDIALHGHSHIPRKTDTNGSPSEFSGTSRDQQINLIKEGSALITSVFDDKPIGFVPPWNSYDQNTADVLNELDYKYISAGSVNFQSGSLVPLPRTCTMRNALSTIRESEKFKKFSPVIVVVFHPDEFEEFCYPPDPGDAPPFTSLIKLNELLTYINEHQDIEISSIKCVAHSTNHSRSLWTPHQLKLPWRFKALVSPGILFRSSRLRVFSRMLKDMLLNR